MYKENVHPIHKESMRKTRSLQEDRRREMTQYEYAHEHNRSMTADKIT